MPSGYCDDSSSSVYILCGGIRLTTSGFSSEHDSVLHSSRPRQIQAIFRSIDEWLRRHRLIEKHGKNSHAYHLPESVSSEKNPLATVQYEDKGDRYVELRFYRNVLVSIDLWSTYSGYWEKADYRAEAPMFSLEVSDGGNEYKMGFNIEGFDEARWAMKLMDPLLNKVDSIIESRV